MLVISAYTPSYKNVADRLKSSLCKHQISHSIFPIADQGSWVKNCGMKPQVILSALLEYNKPIVWIDADAVVHEYPALFNFIKEDIGFHQMKRRGRRGCELLSGTLFFNNTKPSVRVLTEWQKLQKKKPDEWDQKNLVHVLRIVPCTYYLLPPSYCQIYDTMKDCGKPVIEHFQESRKHRRK